MQKKCIKNAKKCIKIHKNANAFSRSQTIFLQKIQIVCGFWNPGNPAFRMYAKTFFFQSLIFHNSDTLCGLKQNVYVLKILKFCTGS